MDQAKSAHETAKSAQELMDVANAVAGGDKSVEDTVLKSVEGKVLDTSAERGPSQARSPIAHLHP